MSVGQSITESITQWRASACSYVFWVRLKMAGLRVKGHPTAEAPSTLLGASAMLTEHMSWIPYFKCYCARKKRN